MPDIGDKVYIRPTMQRVLADSSSGRFLSDAGEEVVWTAHHMERLKHGEIAIVAASSSAPAPAHALPSHQD